MIFRLSSLLALSVLIIFYSPVHSEQRVIEGTVTKVSDGDTIQVLTDNQTKIRLRLAEIDCPETLKINHKTGRVSKPGQPFGQEAADLTARLVMGKRVKVVTYGPDKYKRVLAFVFVDGMNVNLELIRAGLAEVYRGEEL